MNNQKGFTLVEMMVAGGLLVIALAGAMSFFIYQSHKGSDATTIKGARENLTLALMLIQRDLMAAGYGVMGVSTIDPKTLSVVPTASYGLDKVNGNLYSSTDSTTLQPDKLHIGYGTFLDMNFDINGVNDTNSVFRYSATKNIGGSPQSTFIYDLFPVEMAISTDNKVVGGFICGTCAGGQPGAGDVNWTTAGSKTVGTKSWTVKLQSTSSTGTPATFQNSLNGNVTPAIVYRIAQDFGHLWADPVNGPPYELQRNGVRIAGGDPRLEVYNLKVVDETASDADPTKRKRRYSIRIDYQVKLGGSNQESNLHGTAKVTWFKGYVTIKADPRVIILSGG